MINIKEKDMKLVKEILNKNFPNLEVRAFGSRVNGEIKEYSDLDLVIMGDKKISFRDMRKAKEDFQESELNFRVDIVDWNGIDDNFRDIIDKYSKKIK